MLFFFFLADFVDDNRMNEQNWVVYCVKWTIFISLFWQMQNYRFFSFPSYRVNCCELIAQALFNVNEVSASQQLFFVLCIYSILFIAQCNTQKSDCWLKGKHFHGFGLIKNVNFLIIVLLFDITAERFKKNIWALMKNWGKKNVRKWMQ